MIVQTADQFEYMMQFLRGKPWLIFDWETSGTRWWAHARGCGLALGSWDEAGQIRSFYVPMAHVGDVDFQWDPHRILPIINQLFLDQTSVKIAHNLKFDAHINRVMGLALEGPLFCTMVGARAYDDNNFVALKRRAVDDLGYRHAGHWEGLVDAEIKRLAKDNKLTKTKYLDRFGYSELPIDLTGFYACHDIQFCGELFQLYLPTVQSMPIVWPAEMDLLDALVATEARGQRIDVDYLANLKLGLSSHKKMLERRIEKQLGSRMFTLSSDAKLREFLLVSGCRWEETTKAGLPSVDAFVLKKLTPTLPILETVREWRDAQKLYTTYTQSLIDAADTNGFVHPNFKQEGTNTGRLSCSNPNFQNVAGDSKAHPHWSIRKAFLTPGDGWVRLFRDYSQIELRVLAFYSKDRVLCESYLSGEDVHARTATEVFGSPAPEYRRRAKIINFGLSYGLSPIGFARQVGVSVEEAKAFYEKFWQKYPGIAQFRAEFINHCVSQGCEFRNLFGRIRRIPDLGSGLIKEQSRAQRQAIGSLIQGTAGEFTKISYGRIHKWLKAESLEDQAFLDGTVHDELSVACRGEVFAKVNAGMREIMEDFPQFHPIPILSGLEVTTTNWSAKTEVDEQRSPS